MVGQKKEVGATGEAVARNVKRLREAANLTYTEVSKALAGIDRPISPLAVRRIEEGERRVDVDDLVALALVLNVAPVSLLYPGAKERGDEVLATGLNSPVSAETLWNWMVADSPIVAWDSDVELFGFLGASIPPWRRQWLGDALRSLIEKATAEGSENDDYRTRLAALHLGWSAKLGPDGDD